MLSMGRRACKEEKLRVEVCSYLFVVLTPDLSN